MHDGLEDFHYVVVVLFALLLFLPDTTINFELPQYTVREADGEVTVCARLAQNTLERSVIVTLSTEDSSALG